MTDQAKPGGASFLKKRIDQDTKEALKSKDSLTLSVLRMLKSDIRYKEIEKGSELSDDDVISVLSSATKRRKDSIQQFERGGRDDLASKEKEEVAVIARYMPEQLGEEELSQIISQAISEENAAGPSDLGKVMKQVMSKVRGRADGKKVNQMVSSQLESVSQDE
jgi:uncharacterized protein YqeY